MSLRLPDTVYLPTGVTLHPSEVRNACGGISRAGLLYWRSKHDFPTPYGSNNQSYYMADEVAAWLAQQGCEVCWL